MIENRNVSSVVQQSLLQRNIVASIVRRARVPGGVDITMWLAQRPRLGAKQNIQFHVASVGTTLTTD